MPKSAGLRGNRLKEVRERQGISQEDLAKQLGVSQPNIVRWEKEQVDPASETLARIAAILDVSADYLLGLVDEPHQNITEEPLTPMQRRLLWALDKGLIPEALEAFASITKGEN